MKIESSSATELTQNRPSSTLIKNYISLHCD